MCRHCATHWVEKIWNHFTPSESEETVDTVPAELHAVVMSQAAQGEVYATKTMKFLGSIQGVQLLILLDSGSSHTFLSAVVASQLTGCSQLCQPLSVCRLPTGLVSSAPQNCIMPLGTSMTTSSPPH
jgi:hypothetical protein